jgi:hypothetical protein
VVGLCWCVWQESGFSRREDVFKFILKRHKICFLNAVCKDAAAINCTAVLFNFDGTCYTSFYYKISGKGVD